MATKTRKKTKEKRTAFDSLCADFLMLMSVSLLGWTMETVLTFFQTGRFHDRGFLYAPFCPIYGCSVLAAYFLLGTPDEGRFLLKKVENKAARYVLYFFLAAIIPSLAEFLVGLFFDKTFDLWLWDYSGMPLNLNGYVCLPISIVWAALIFAFMKFVFTPLRNLFLRLPKAVLRAVAVSLFALLAVDLFFSILTL